MNLGKYAIEDLEDEETSQQEDRPAESQVRAGGRRNPHQGDQQAQPRPGTSRSSSRSRPTHTSAPIGSPGPSFVQPAVLPPYWSTSYASSASHTAHSGYVPWQQHSQAPTFSGATAGFFPNPPTHAQGPFLRSMARFMSPATYGNPRRLWSERGRRLLPKIRKDAFYSKKVFVGGLPSSMTAQTLMEIFHHFDVRDIIKKETEAHAYLILGSDAAVKDLLSKCSMNEYGDYFFEIGIKRGAQVIPWAMQDAEYGREGRGLEKNTIFVGGLHGETTAEHLRMIMEETFGRVRYVKIDTDEYYYPSGSARVQFELQASCREAIELNYLSIHAKHYLRTVQLEPFFERGRLCSKCRWNSNTELCRFVECLDYFCQPCFQAHQQERGIFAYQHQPVGHRSSRRGDRR